jgi:hypothetical protein
MNAVSLSILVWSIWPLLVEPQGKPPTAARPHRASFSRRQEACYKQIWCGSFDPFASIEPSLDDTADELRVAIRNADGPIAEPRPVLAGSAAAVTTSNPWAAYGFRDEDIRRKMGRQFDLELAMLNSKLVLVDPNVNPYVPLRRSGWQTDESVKLPLSGSLFVVGQFQANSGSVEWQQYQFVGRTGLGMRVPWLGGEIQVRGGRSMANYDPDVENMFPGRVQTFFELATKWPIIGKINLEYTGKAIPAQLPSDHDVLRQELKLAIPFSDSGQFHVGARYRWDDVATPSPWIERMNMFIGLQMKR